MALTFPTFFWQVPPEQNKKESLKKIQPNQRNKFNTTTKEREPSHIPRLVRVNAGSFFLLSIEIFPTFQHYGPQSHVSCPLCHQANVLSSHSTINYVACQPVLWVLHYTTMIPGVLQETPTKVVQSLYFC